MLICPTIFLNTKQE